MIPYFKIKLGFFLDFIVVLFHYISALQDVKDILDISLPVLLYFIFQFRILRHFTLDSICFLVKW